LKFELGFGLEERILQQMDKKARKNTLNSLISLLYQKSKLDIPSNLAKIYYNLLALYKSISNELEITKRLKESHQFTNLR